jgi:hypothetical protein
MRPIYYDPRTWEWIPTPTDYSIKVYDRNSWLIQKVGTSMADVVDFEGEQGSPQCTCADYLYRKSLEKPLKKWDYTTCKHIRLVQTMLRFAPGQNDSK